MPPSDPTRTLSPGCGFGRYRLESCLARGGMGEVWLATAHGPADFKKRVAIKTVLPNLKEKPGYVEMLIREASLAAGLDHPNIVQTFDLGCIDGIYFIAMEYLSGCTLTHILRRTHERGERVPLGVLLTIAAAACDGLKYAHAYADDDGKPIGLLHRDISPSNIMITREGRVALLDFGVATAQVSRFATNSGTLKGKFHYLPPERVRGQPGDLRSDLYSLGVVLYQGLTYRLPFRSESDYELLRQIAHEVPPPPRQHAPWLSVDLEEIVMTAMARDVNARFPGAGEMGDRLREHQRSISAEVDAHGLGAYVGRIFPELMARGDRATVPPPEPAGDEPESEDPEEQLGLEEKAATPPPARVRPPPIKPRAARTSKPPRSEDSEVVPRRADSSGSLSEVTAAEDELRAAESPSAALRTARGSSGVPPAAGPVRASSDSGWFATGSEAMVPPRNPDIFPEPTRVAPLGGDLFGGDGARPPRRRRRATGPAFFVGRPPQAEEGWPWAKGVDDRRDPEAPPTSTNGGGEDTG